MFFQVSGVLFGNPADNFSGLRSGTFFRPKEDPGIHLDEPYTLIESYYNRLVELKRYDPRMVINSYTCSAYYRDQVHSLARKYPRLYDNIITTSNRVSRGGKAMSLFCICCYRRCCGIHIDDSAEVLEEFIGFREYRLQHGCTAELRAVGIRAPRKQKAGGVRYFRNLGDALGELDLDFLLSRVPRQASSAQLLRAGGCVVNPSAVAKLCIGLYDFNTPPGT